jgi:hypothetical protein
MKVKEALAGQTPHPAFPTLNITPGHEAGVSSVSGMTLRDYFAAKAMQADLTNYGGANWERVANFAYEMADAMLKARVKNG